jgi:type I restriction enzyme, S subunit
MKKYDSYKDSEIEWIGDIPSHWNEKRLKYVAFANPSNIDKKSKENEPEVFLCNYTDVYKNEFITKDIDFMKATANEAQIEKFSLEKSDVIATKDSESANDIGVPALVLENLENVVCGYHLTHIKPHSVRGEYLFRIFQTKYSKSYFEISANGVTRYALGVDDFNCFKVLLPPSAEQTAIANFLDRKTAEIDELIADKKRLLELYEEEKTSIINQAVTKGINPDAQMKNSGIEWLGEIPEHWEVKRLKILVSKIGSGVTPSGGSSVYQTSGTPLLRSQNIHFDGLKLDDVAYITDKIDEGMSNSRIQENDVLLNITGASIGRCFYVPEGFGRGNVNQHVCILRPIIQKIHVQFLYYQMRSLVGQVQINLQQTGANREGLNFEQLKNFQIPIPLATQEQTEIVHHIKVATDLIENKKTKTEKLIELLTEYRTALISEVVTGKIKVVGVKNE